MSRIFYLIFSLLPLLAVGQTPFSPEERAYLFHTVKKSPILNEEIGSFFDYLGPEIRISADELNYDSIERIIVAQPELLIIRTGEIRKSEKGIIAEAANKMALWELNKLILAKSSDSASFSLFKDRYHQLERLFLNDLPENALEALPGNTKQLKASFLPLLNPHMFTNEKIDLLETFRFLDEEERFSTLKTLQSAIHKYVADRTLNIYTTLGGEQHTFQNILLAAGDGVILPERFEEREKDEKNRWNKGLPKAVGFFPYSLEKKKATTENERTINTSNFEVLSLSTPGENRLTRIHFDVWGFNPKRQMTVILEKNGMQYPLFGKLDSRFLSPDSTYGGEMTFKGMMDDFQENYIEVLEKKIFGRRGYDWAIRHFTALRDQAELDLMKAEYDYSVLHTKPITTKNKATKAYKKKKKAVRKGKVVRKEGLVDPVKNDGRKEKRTKENEIIYLQGEIESLNRQIKEYQIIRARGLALLEQYRSQLFVYKRWYGDNWSTFESRDGVYTFSDGATFDIKTQEFTFQPTAEKEEFAVRVLPVPDAPDLNTTDEVMLHINVIDGVPNHDARIRLELNDHFEKGSFTALNPLFNEAEDSASIVLFLKQLTDKNHPLKVQADGHGIGVWNGCRVAPSGTGNNLFGNKEGTSLETTHLYVQLEKETTLMVESFVDGSELTEPAVKEELKAYVNKYALNKQQVLTACRCAAVLKQFKTEMCTYAQRYLPADQYASVKAQIEKKINKVNVNTGAAAIPLGKF
jgi:hypothetical protein